MSIPETISFDKSGQAEERRPGRDLVHRLFLSLVIILVATLSFGIGRLTSPGAGQGIRIEYDASISNSQVPISNTAQASQALNPIENSQLKIDNSAAVVGSKNGTKYHYLHCLGAKQIKEANKITFTSAEAAKSAGYTLAANCLPR